MSVFSLVDGHETANQPKVLPLKSRQNAWLVGSL